MKNAIIVGLLMLNSFINWGQTYSNDRAKFVKEFQKALSDFGKGEYTDFVKKELTVSLLETSEFSEPRFSKMVETCNLLITKKMDPYPEIYNYVFSVYSLVKTKQPESSVNAWNSAIDKLLESRNVKKFTDFAEMSAGFFSERRLTDKGNFSWFYEGGTYEFLYTDKPFIKVANGNLVCRIINKEADSKRDAKFNDSLVIYKTSGEYDPVLKKWDGNGGKINWEKVGLDPSKTFAEIGDYALSMKTSTMSADSVRLTSPYFSTPILGKISDRAFKINREEDKVFPQFLSYEKSLKIKEIRPNLDYEGGFSLQGNKFVGAGTASQPSKVTLHRNGKPFIVATSANIYLSDEKVYGMNTRIALYLNTGDSITHPGLNFNYFTSTKFVELSRPSTGIGQAPFQDSYHQIDYYVPRLVWEENGNTIQFTYEKGTSQEQRLARFESRNFFDARLYDQLQGLASMHPLVAIHNYSYKYDKTIINEGECATALGGTVEQVKPLMLQLSNLGFISYDTESKMVIVNKKTENFVRGRAKKQDYDNINFVCDFRPKTLNGYSEEQIESDTYLQEVQELYKRQTQERSTLLEFGNLNLSTMDISLNAVDRVTLSDKQNTHVFPENGQIIVKKNRDFEFKGWFNAGKLEVNTQTASYNYEENKVNLIKTKESLFRIKPLNPQHGNTGIAMETVIQGIEGEIFVDAPENRSGNSDKFPNYPSLNVKKPSYVYYNSPAIYKGAYDSTRFYYTLQPFVLDSLDDFTEKSLRLKGELTSAGIFPAIKEDLKIMPDYSFGFSTTAPTAGLDFYGTGAKYENKILLSNKGLQGAGTINFVQSTSISKDLLTFLPDSTLGLVSFVNRPVETGIQFPDASSDEAYMTYIPKQKILKAASTPKNDFKFFGDEQAKLRGTAYVTPEGMRGKGMMTFATASLVSDDFVYKRWDIDADTSGFNLKNSYQEEGEDPLAFETNNVNSHVSFKDRKGEFRSNNGESRVEFPVNQYICKMDMFTWFMDQESIEMSKTETKEINIDTGLDLVGPNFYSIHPKQDSLQFRAPKAKFSLKEKTIYCSKVEYLDIADARIYPDSMKVTIRKKAVLDRFENSKIVANYITKYHTFQKASVEVLARRSYKGTGEYPYYDRDSVATFIKMESIGLDTSYQTVALGKIEKESNFKLSPEFDYYGQISVKAANPSINFNGATRINHSCEKFEKSWLAFNSEIDPKNIQIPVSSQMKNLDGGAIAAGIVWRDAANVDSIELYPTFLSALQDPNDPIVMTSSGFLSYNSEASEFQIASKEKFINRNGKGNFLALHTQSCSMNGDGIVNLGMDYGDVDVATVGVVNYDQSTGKTTMNLTAKFTMPLDQGLFKGVATRIAAVEGLNPMDFNSNTLEAALVQWTDQSQADKFKEDYTIKGEVKKIPKELENSIVVTGLRLSSFSNNPNIKGLITNVDAAILVNVYDKPVTKYVPMRAFFQQRYSGAVGGDKFGILIDLPGGLDYFLDYTMSKKDGVLEIVTGDTELSSGISGLKDDKLKTKNFSYRLGSNSLRTVFNNLFVE